MMQVTNIKVTKINKETSKDMPRWCWIAASSWKTLEYSRETAS